MSLNRIFDLKNTILSFEELIKKKRLSPAYIFTGGNLRDEKEAVLELSKLITCSNNYSSGCVCLGCQKIENLKHPDVIWVEVLSNSQSIKIEQIRELKRKVFLEPYEAGRKVFIINQAEKMTEESQNALLKTLEEMPRDSVLFLISNNLQGLLETIISRCKIIRFAGKGDLLLETERCEIIDRFLKTDIAEIEDFFDYQTKEQFLSAIEALLTLYRDILILKSKADKSLLLNRAKVDKIIDLTGSYTYEDLYRILSFLSMMCKYIKSNLNLKTCIINTIFEFKDIMKIEVV